jgi:hypothetical protein
MADEAVDAPAPPAALSFTPFGTLMSRYEMRRNYSLGVPGGPGEDAVRYRTRFGVRAQPVSIADGLSVSARVAAQAAGQWSVGGDTLEHPSLSLHEGLIGLHVGETRIDIGRFEMAYGEHLVIGTVDWNPIGRAFDGARSHSVLASGVWIDVFATSIDESWARAETGDTIAEGDVFFNGLYAGFGPAIGEGIEVDAYLLSRALPALRTSTQSRDGTADLTIGGRYKDRIGALDIRAEAGYQLGGRALADNTDVRSASAYQADAELGVNFVEGSTRLALEGFRASGDDPETADTDEGWAQLYPTGHRWLGHMDVIPGRSDVQGGVFHFSVKPTANHTIFADLHTFFHVVEPASGERYRGGELDLGASHRLGRGLVLREEIGAFKPTSAAEDDDMRYFAELELRLTIPLPE